jgi:hypothetical protein
MPTMTPCRRRFIRSGAAATVRRVTDRQGSLIDLSSDAAPAPRRRRSSKGIAPGDIVEVDKKGRRFHALVEALEQSGSGRFELDLRPLARGVSYRRAMIREVVAVWRRA